MNEKNRLLLREYLSEEAALLIKNTMVFRHCLGAAWENDAGEEVEQLIDALTCADLAVAASHVNSYPRAALGGRCPVDAARALLPEGFVDLLGVVKVPLEEVVLRPSLLPHAVDR